MNILMLSNTSDEHAIHLSNMLRELNVNVHYFDAQLFPQKIGLSWQPNSENNCIKLNSELSLNLNEIHSIFWRSFAAACPPTLENNYQQMIAYHDSMSALKTVIKACPTHWVNSWDAYEFHQHKPLQLRQVKQLGVTIPQTLITNDPEQVLQFTQSHKKLIFKPVYGGIHTQFLTDFHLEKQRLNLSLKIAPITLQEYIPGTNIRTYVIADSVYSAEIRSHHLDFREDETAELIPIDTPEIIQKQSIAITQELLMEWTAIDWRLTPDGDYVFLEANPSPMFLYFEQETGYPISKKLVNLLMS